MKKAKVQAELAATKVKKARKDNSSGSNFGWENYHEIQESYKAVVNIVIDPRELTFIDTKGESHKVLVNIDCKKEYKLAVDMHNHIAWKEKGQESKSILAKTKDFESKYGKLF